LSALAQLQRELLASIFDAAPVAADAAGRGLEIYRRNVLGGLHDALASTYPVVRRLVGEAFFREAAIAFARASPSTSGDLHEYGGGFAAFLATYPHAAGLPYLPDVARLEWAVHQSFHAADVPPLDYAPLARLAPRRYGELRFRLHPSARLVRSPYPILAIWEANQGGRDGTPEGDANAQRVLVIRKDLVVRPQPLDPIDWTFLAAIERGDRLEDAADAVGEAAGGYLAAALARYAAAGVIAGYCAA
jgi:hypothetical protein